MHLPFSGKFFYVRCGVQTCVDVLPPPSIAMCVVLTNWATETSREKKVQIVHIMKLTAIIVHWFLFSTRQFQLRNKFHFSEVHENMNAMGHMQSKWHLNMLTLHGTCWVHTSMNLRKIKFISYIYTLILLCFCSLFVFGYYVPQPSLWHDVNRTFHRPINYCIYLWRRLCIGLGRVEILYLGTRVPITRRHPDTRYHSILACPLLENKCLNENNKEHQSVCLSFVHLCVGGYETVEIFVL